MLIINLDIKSSTTKLTNLIEALNEKLNAADSLSTTNNTKIGLQEIQIAKLREDIESLKDKSIAKWKVNQRVILQFLAIKI